MRTIFLNEDDAHFYSCHPTSDMTVEGLEKLVDYYATNTQVGGLLFCTNLQKALFDSHVWEPLYADYDPDSGSDQPCLLKLKPELREVIPGDHARNWVHNLWVLNRQNGINHHQVWIDRCRYHGIEGWLTMRMNDSHGLKEFARDEQGIEPCGNWLMLCPSKHWQNNPQLRRAPWRWERSWEGSYDYSHQQVREHHMALITELCDRFDMDGLELDWMRWGQMFSPGNEAKGRVILNDFVRQVRAKLDVAQKRVGHRIKLGVRVPSLPQEALANGYDVPTWGREGLVDQVVLSSFFGFANFDIPIEIWRLILGDHVRLLVHGSGVATAYPESQITVEHIDHHYATASSALHRGADGIYLFNECYTESSNPKQLKTMLQNQGSLDTIDKVTRRYAVTWPCHRAPGDMQCTLLPIPLTPPSIGRDMGRMENNITLRIHIGRKPAAGSATLLLAMSPDAAKLDMDNILARLNGKPIQLMSNPPQCSAQCNPINQRYDVSREIGWTLGFKLPLDYLHDDTNIIEFLPPVSSQVPGEIRWAEILIVP
ncbi:MAG TPA: hypothetical protein DCM28_07330 [Phycisphaerales bacterium]|nr:hypothetical protein [Phycisphaerales bacterium]HCD31480.1 hypothetical protein [Phycisphaerales bacterium]|tara:strand:- start:516 stop:2138 length:1623 start_codon:yes stop_codon:yes gene_type:complete